MSAKNLIDLQNQLSLLIPDNTTQEISADDERTVIGEGYESFLNLKDGGLVVEALTGYSTNLVPLDNKHFANKKYVDDSISGISVPTISDVAYDATSWNANLDGATKNALRDKFFLIDTSIATAFIDGGNNFGADAILGLTSNNKLSVYTNNLERIRINANGTVCVNEKLLVGSTDTSYLTNTQTAFVGGGNTSATSTIKGYNSDTALIYNLRDDGDHVMYANIRFGSSGLKRWDLSNNLLYANDGSSDRIDINNGALYYGGAIRLDWSQNLLKYDTWKVDDGDFILSNSSKAYYIGPSGTDGSWRRRIDGSDLVDERRESGVWVEKSRTVA